MTESRAAPSGRGLRLAYAALLFVSSAGALVLEIVAGRLLAPYVGMSLYTWTAIIAVVLAGLSIGHWLGGLLASDEARLCRRRAAVSLILAGLAAALSLPLLRLISGPLLAGQLGPIAAIVALSAGLFLLPSLFIGLVSPLLTHLAVESATERRGAVLGRMFAAGALGSIAGTLAAGFLFISWIGSSGSVLAVAAVLLLAGLALLLPSVSRRAGLGALALSGLAAGGLLTGGLASGAYETPCDRESQYYCIRVLDFSAEAGRPSALMVLDHLGHGINDRDDPTRLHSSYTELADRLVALRLPEKPDLSAFFIGGGAFTLPRAWAARYPEGRLLVAEIDPAVTEVAERDFWLQPSSALAVVHEDARRALKSLPEGERFDVVLGDAFHDISVPQHLVTSEFDREIADRLTPDGIYLLNVVDGARRPLFLFAVLRSLREAFPVTEVWADAEQLLGGGRITYLVLAGGEATPAARLTSEQDESRLWVRWPASDLDALIAESGAPLLTDDFAPVDRLLYPVAALEP